MAEIRLDKYIASMSAGSRKEVKQLIRQGRVSCDGHTVLLPEKKVDPDRTIVRVDGELLSYHEFEYYMLNKPQGYVSATKDDRYPVVLELITGYKRKDLFPAGRLDIDTEGLLLITNDGKLTDFLLSPKHHVEKEYFVTVEGVLTEDEVAQLETGLDIGDARPTLPARLEIISMEEERSTTVRLCITEGRYHQVKRMFAAIGKPVRYLKRLRMGSLCLDETLHTGEYRRLTAKEVDALRKLPKSPIYKT